MVTPPPIVSLEQATVRYAGSQTPALDGVDFALAPGERVGLAGDNGSGKSTLLLALTGLRPLSSGRLLHAGQPAPSAKALLRLRRDVGMVFQQADDQLFSPTVLEDVAFGPLNLGLSQEDARHRALETLEGLGIASLGQRLTHTLSGGQKRMAALATALAMQPRALLLDEPTNDLDARGRHTLERILLQSRLALVLVSHDEGFLSRITHRRVQLAEGRIVSD